MGYHHCLDEKYFALPRPGDRDYHVSPLPPTEAELAAEAAEKAQREAELQERIRVEVPAVLGTGEYPWYHESFDPNLFWDRNFSCVRPELHGNIEYSRWLPEGAALDFIDEMEHAAYERYLKMFFQGLSVKEEILAKITEAESLGEDLAWCRKVVEDEVDMRYFVGPSKKIAEVVSNVDHWLGIAKDRAATVQADADKRRKVQACGSIEGAPSAMMAAFMAAKRK